jgi:hypothetical protein
MNSKRHLFAVGSIISVFCMIQLGCGSALEDRILPVPTRVVAMPLTYNSGRINLGSG